MCLCLIRNDEFLLVLLYLSSMSVAETAVNLAEAELAEVKRKNKEHKAKADKYNQLTVKFCYGSLVLLILLLFLLFIDMYKVYDQDKKSQPPSTSGFCSSSGCDYDKPDCCSGYDSDSSSSSDSDNELEEGFMPKAANHLTARERIGSARANVISAFTPNKKNSKDFEHSGAYGEDNELDFEKLSESVQKHKSAEPRRYNPISIQNEQDSKLAAYVAARKASARRATVDTSREQYLQKLPEQAPMPVRAAAASLVMQSTRSGERSQQAGGSTSGNREFSGAGPIRGLGEDYDITPPNIGGDEDAPYDLSEPEIYERARLHQVAATHGFERPSAANAFRNSLGEVIGRTNGGGVGSSDVYTQ